MKNKTNKIVLALDFDEQKKALTAVKKLKDHVGMFKVGKQLFTKYGPEIVKKIHNLGGEVFLDLKFHDIPNTVANAAVECMNLGVKMFNVHISGGSEMLIKTVSKIKNHAREIQSNPPIILGVTVLTSIDAKILKQDIKCALNLKQQVIHFAKMAKKCGLDGVVASPHEISLIRKHCGKHFIILTPGIRPLWSQKNDQKRIMTPYDAIAKGADYIVIGRAITFEKDMVAAAKKINEEINQVPKGKK